MLCTPGVPTCRRRDDNMDSLRLQSAAVNGSNRAGDFKPTPRGVHDMKPVISSSGERMLRYRDKSGRSGFRFVWIGLLKGGFGNRAIDSPTGSHPEYPDGHS